MNKIIPAILPTSIPDLDSKLAQLPEEIKLMHLDVLEEDIWSENVHIDFEAHLMVKKPDDIIERWVERGAKRMIVHKLSEKIKSLRDKTKIGLAIELQAPLEEVY